jgi:predicted DsbA family dithiol-disulfide isomerase
MKDNIETVSVEVYSDVVCPWCYIGGRRLEKAIAQRPDIKVERHWQPFQLRPEMPKEGVAWSDFVQQKFGGPERAEGIFAKVTETGAAEGIEFRFDSISSAPNTLDAHRLILLAREHGVEGEMVRDLYSAYFTQERNLNDHDQLVDIALEVGLEERQVRAYLAGDKNVGEVNDGQHKAEQLAITGVPFYVFNGTYALSGAQPVEAFLHVLDLIAAEATAA